MQDPDKTETPAARQKITLLKDCRHGKMLFLANDIYIGRSLDAYGEFSELEAEVFRAFLRPGDSVVEVGANIGAHTVHLARLVGPKGTIFAFEPQRVIFLLLCANVALNELFNVRTFHRALGRDEGMTRIPPLDYAQTNNFGGVSLTASGGGEEVSVGRLDDAGFPPFRMLKVDVEGMEAHVLAGARQTIRKYRPILYVENDRQDRSVELISLIDELGYDMWWHLPPMFNPNNFAKNPNNVLENIASINLLCLPKEWHKPVKGLKPVSGPTDSWQNAPPSGR